MGTSQDADEFHRTYDGEQLRIKGRAGRCQEEQDAHYQRVNACVPC